MYIKKKYEFYVIIISLFILIYPALGSRIEIVNENKKDLTIKVKVDRKVSDMKKEKLSSAISGSLSTYVKKIPAEENSILILDSKDVNGEKHYFIKGDTGAIVFGGKCEFLSIDKNYRVTFLNDLVGTTCLAEEIK